VAVSVGSCSAVGLVVGVGVVEEQPDATSAAKIKTDAIFFFIFYPVWVIPEIFKRANLLIIALSKRPVNLVGRRRPGNSVPEESLPVGQQLYFANQLC
jgi:hypothetical protein